MSSGYLWLVVSILELKLFAVVLESLVVLVPGSWNVQDLDQDFEIVVLQDCTAVALGSGGGRQEARSSLEQ